MSIFTEGQAEGAYPVKAQCDPLEDRIKKARKDLERLEAEVKGLIAVAKYYKSSYGLGLSLGELIGDVVVLCEKKKDWVDQLIKQQEKESK